MNRLRAMAAAMAASRAARAAELERQRSNPDFFSQRGGIELTWLHATWPLATLSGDREALRLWCPAGVFSPYRLFVFPRSRIRRLSEHLGLFSVGLRIEHIEESYPKFIVFRVFNFAKLKSKLTRLGYDVHDWPAS
jgi:hypothetical protein